MEEIQELGSSRSGSIHCLSIIGQIEGHLGLPEDTKSTKYEHVMPQLLAVEESREIEGLLILLGVAATDTEDDALVLARKIVNSEKKQQEILSEKINRLTASLHESSQLMNEKFILSVKGEEQAKELEAEKKYNDNSCFLLDIAS